MVELPVPQAFELDELGNEWNCTLKKVWSYINAGDLLVCVHKTDVQKVFHDPNSKNLLCGLSDLDRITRVLKRALPSVKMGATNLHPQQYKSLNVELKCIADDSTSGLVYENNIVMDLPEYLYLTTTQVNDSSTGIGQNNPLFIHFNNNGNRYQLVASICASFESGDRVSGNFFINTCDIKGMGPLLVTNKDKLAFEAATKKSSIENEIDNINPEQDWKITARNLAIEMLKINPATPLNHVANEINKVFLDKGIKGRGGKALKIETIKREALTGLKKQAKQS